MTKKLKLYLISQEENTDYDTYSDAVVIAGSRKEAKRIHPYGDRDMYYDEKKKQFWGLYSGSKEPYRFEDTYGSWTNNLNAIDVEYLGPAKKNSKKGLVCSSFHAG